MRRLNRFSQKALRKHLQSNLTDCRLSGSYFSLIGSNLMTSINITCMDKRYMLSLAQEKSLSELGNAG